MIDFRHIARNIRHLPLLERAEPLWRVLRKPYHLALNANGRGVAINVGSKAAIRIPAEYAGMDWELFEPESVAAFCDWVHRHPGSMVLDIGCSIGIYSAIALFADLCVEVIAFDSDLESLAATRRLCRHAQGDRLQLVHGFITKEATEATTLGKAVALTEAAMKRRNVQGEFGANRFICLTDREAVSIPRRRIDDLFAIGEFDRRALLVKCDVEGAELLVLSGGEKLLRGAHPDLLLSVHPPALPSYGHSAEDLRAFLKRLDYDIRCLAVDHEEHWWCHFRGDA